MKIAQFFKRVENTVGKGEIARYEQFLLFPLCFQKACFPGGGGSKGVIVWEWVKLVQPEFLSMGKNLNHVEIHKEKNYLLQTLTIMSKNVTLSTSKGARSI